MYICMYVLKTECSAAAVRASSVRTPVASLCDGCELSLRRCESETCGGPTEAAGAWLRREPPVGREKRFFGRWREEFVTLFFLRGEREKKKKKVRSRLASFCASFTVRAVAYTAHTFPSGPAQHADVGAGAPPPRDIRKHQACAPLRQVFPAMFVVDQRKRHSDEAATDRFELESVSIHLSATYTLYCPDSVY